MLGIDQGAVGIQPVFVAVAEYHFAHRQPVGVAVPFMQVGTLFERPVYIGLTDTVGESKGLIGADIQGRQLLE